MKPFFNAIPNDDDNSDLKVKVRASRRKSRYYVGKVKSNDRYVVDDFASDKKGRAELYSILTLMICCWWLFIVALLLAARLNWAEDFNILVEDDDYSDSMRIIIT